MAQTMIRAFTVTSLVAIGSFACHQPGTARVEPTPLDSANAIQAAIARVAARSARSVVSLKCLDSTGSAVRFGTGFIAAGGRVVTNTHVVRGCSRVEVRDRFGALLLTARSVVAYCYTVDVVALPAIPSLPPSLHLGRSLPAVGQRIVVIGAQEGPAQTVSDGMVSAIRRGNDEGWFQVTAQISSASSGGPMLDLHGDVVGIAVVRSTGRQDVTSAVPASAITGVLAGYVRRVAFTDIPDGQETGDAQGAQSHEAAASNDSVTAAGVRQAKAIIDNAVWDTASAQTCQRQKDTVCLRRLRDPLASTIAHARSYLTAGFASHDSTVWLLTAAVALAGGSKLAQAGAYDEAYEWLDQLMIALARDSSDAMSAQEHQIRVQASFWFALADAVTLAKPYKEMIESRSCIPKNLVRDRIRRGLEALDVGDSVAPTASQIRGILLKYLSNIDRVTQVFHCAYC